MQAALSARRTKGGFPGMSIFSSGRDHFFSRRITFFSPFFYQPASLHQLEILYNTYHFHFRYPTITSAKIRENPSSSRKRLREKDNK